LYSIGSRYFYKILYKISDIKVPVGVGEFRLIDRKVINVMNTLKEKTRFLRGLTIWPGFSHATIEIERKKRLTGETKYNLLKSLSVAVDGFVSFSIAPLRVTVIMGLIMFIIALIGIFYAITLRLTTESWVSGWTLLFVSIMFLGAMQFIILGIIGEYVGRIFLEVLDRPLYVIDYEIGEINKR
jgi:dolichol-phosphate mannosyltransferase